MTLNNQVKQYSEDRWAVDLIHLVQLSSPSVRRLGNTETCSIFNLYNLSVPYSVYITQDESRSVRKCGALLVYGWVSHKGWCVTDSVTPQWPLYTYYTLYMTHLHSTCIYSLSTRTLPLIRVINIPEQCSDPFPGASVFCSHKLSKHFCLWRPVSVFSAFAWYLASFKSNTLTTDLYFRETETEWERKREREYECVSWCVIVYTRRLCTLAAGERDVSLQDLFFAN